MPAINYDILIEQGATYTQEFVWKDSEGDPVDLSGYVARMQIRQFKTDNLLITLTDEDGITLGGEYGTIVLEIPAETTSTLDVCKARYDLELEDEEGIVTRLVQGNATISYEVTK